MNLVRALVAFTDDEGNCGLFSRGFELKLSGGTGPGIILQRIRRLYWVQLHKSQPYPASVAAGHDGDFYAGHLKSAQIDAYAMRKDVNEPHADAEDYWEAWYIPDGGTVPVGDDDQSVLVNDTLGSSRITGAPKATKCTSRGTFIIEAHAFYYPLKQSAGVNHKWTFICARLGLAVGVVKCAGILPSARHDPRVAHASEWIKVAENLASPASENVCHIIAKWDSSVLDKPRIYGETYVAYADGAVTNWSHNAVCAPFDQAALARAAAAAGPVAAAAAAAAPAPPAKRQKLRP